MANGVTGDARASGFPFDVGRCELNIEAHVTDTSDFGAKMEAHRYYYSRTKIIALGAILIVMLVGLPSWLSLQTKFEGTKR